MDIQALEQARARLHRDVTLIDRGTKQINEACRRVRVLANNTGSPEIAAAVAEIEQERDGLRRGLFNVDAPAQLLTIEAKLPRFEALAEAAEAKAAAEFAKQRQLAAQFTASICGHSKPSLCPTLDSAVPTLKLKLDAVWPELGRWAHNEPDRFDQGLADLKAAAESFLTALGVERRGARLRASERTAAQVVTEALTA